MVNDIVGAMVTSTMQTVFGGGKPEETQTMQQMHRISAQASIPAQTEPEINFQGGEVPLEPVSDLYVFEQNYCPPSLAIPLRLRKVEVRRIVMLYNPFSGAQKGSKIAGNANALFRHFGVQVHDIPLEHKGHAEEICRSFDFSGIDVLVALGGDGTFHECVNGLMKRPDRVSILARMPLALIAGGTGNSFALELHGETHVNEAVQHILRGISAPIDIARVSFPLRDEMEDIFSFNSIHWGLGSKVNIQAEKLRWMGNAARYTTAALMSIIQGEKERALITFEDANGNQHEYNDEFCLIIANNIMSAAKGMKMAPNAKLNDGLIDLLLVRSSKAVDLVNIFRKIYDGTHTDLSSVEYLQVRKFSVIPFNQTSGPTQVIEEFVEEIVDIDGELKGSTPFVCEVVPLAIQVIV